jgi:hypothetical protein
MKSEVLEYLFSGTDERMLESKERGAENTLQVHDYNFLCMTNFLFWLCYYNFFVYSLCLHIQRQHEWLPKGWVMEVRAGGEKTNKMYKVYIHEFS